MQCFFALIFFGSLRTTGCWGLPPSSESLDVSSSVPLLPEDDARGTMASSCWWRKSIAVAYSCDHHSDLSIHVLRGSHELWWNQHLAFPDPYFSHITSPLLRKWTHLVHGSMLARFLARESEAVCSLVMKRLFAITTIAGDTSLITKWDITYSILIV